MALSCTFASTSSFFITAAVATMVIARSRACTRRLMAALTAATVRALMRCGIGVDEVRRQAGDLGGDARGEPVLGHVHSDACVPDQEALEECDLVGAQTLLHERDVKPQHQLQRRHGLVARPRTPSRWRRRRRAARRASGRRHTRARACGGSRSSASRSCAWPPNAVRPERERQEVGIGGAHGGVAEQELGLLPIGLVDQLDAPALGRDRLAQLQRVRLRRRARPRGP